MMTRLELGGRRKRNKRFILASTLHDALHEHVLQRADMGALDVVQLVFVVLVNPDGYEFSRSSPATNPPYNASCYDARGQAAIRCWRKNRRPPPSGFPPSCTGVDLNRNFPYHWGGATSSDDPCSDVYKCGSARPPFVLGTSSFWCCDCLCGVLSHAASFESCNSQDVCRRACV